MNDFFVKVGGVLNVVFDVVFYFGEKIFEVKEVLKKYGFDFEE